MCKAATSVTKQSKVYSFYCVYGRCYNTLSFLTTISADQSGGQRGSDERFFRFKVYRGGVKSAPGKAYHYYESLLRVVMSR